VKPGSFLLPGFAYGGAQRLLRAPCQIIIERMRLNPPAALLVPALFASCLLSGCALGDGSPDGQEERPSDRPNIVFIMADDMGYGDVHAVNPGSTIPTPHLDRLAAEGALFTDAHTPSSVCTPTRYGVMTGRYCWRGRLKRGVINGYGKPVIEAGRETVADLLSRAGYHTNIVGKWHLGLEWPAKDPSKPLNGGANIDFAKPIGGAPNAHGFDHSYIIPASLDFPPYVYIEDGQVTEPSVVAQRGQGFPAFLRKGPRAKDLIMVDVLDHLADHASGLIKARANDAQPFFLYLPLPAPHKPVLPHPDYRGRSGLNDYGDFVMQVDGAVGRVLRAIDEAGVRESTLVVYTSDNGSFMYRYDQPGKEDHVEDVKVQGYRPEHHRANGPLRGTKADVWEAGHRVPFLVRWPGVSEPGSRCDATICLTDFFATCADVVGAELGDGVAEDSFSLLPLIAGDEDAWRREPVIHHSANGMFAVRVGKWKLVAGNGSGGRQRPRGKPFGEPYQLFDLDADLAEARDVAAANAEVVAQMSALLQRMREAGRSR
jgi:arylsulfatase A